MPSDEDWAPAKKIASRFFTQIGTLGTLHKEPLWDGKTVSSSSPANLLHEVAHFQIAPEWRRFKPGYGLGIEPEGLAHPPQLVPDVRTAVEESLASVLGVLWQAHLGYEDWRDTAISHGWGPLGCHDETVAGFLKVADEKVRLLLRLGLITPEGVPKPVLAKRWRAKMSPEDE